MTRVAPVALRKPAHFDGARSSLQSVGRGTQTIRSKPGDRAAPTTRSLKKIRRGPQPNYCLDHAGGAGRTPGNETLTSLQQICDASPALRRQRSQVRILSGAPDFNDLANGTRHDLLSRKHHGSTRREEIGQLVACLSVPTW